MSGPKWEYQVIEVNVARKEEIAARLTGLGGLGWELVAVAEQPTSMTSRTLLYLKRMQ